MRKVSLLLVVMMICLGAAPALATEDYPLEEEMIVYQTFRAALEEAGFALHAEDIPAVDYSNYDGTDFVTVTYSPVEGLRFLIDYEDASIYMICLSLHPEAEVYARAGDCMTAALQAVEPAFESGKQAANFLAKLEESGSKTEYEGRDYQVMQPVEGGSDLYETLNLMVTY